jgi:RNA methyltransferase, TrmH family
MKSGRGGRGGGPGATRGVATSAAGGARAAGSVAGAELLSSRDNRWLKEFRVALRGGVATTSGAVGVEGVRLVEEALTSGCKVEAVLFSESGERWRGRLAPFVGRPEMGFPVLRTTDRLFEGIADTEHPQGVAALVVPREVTLEELVGWKGEEEKSNSGAVSEVRVEDEAAPKPLIGQGKLKLPLPKEKKAAEVTAKKCAPLVVVLAGVQDPGNVGTILRTAAAFGATGAVTAATGQSGTASPFAPKSLRASAGAALHLPVVTGMALGILLAQLKVMGIRTVASCVHQEGIGMMAPWEVAWCEPIALLVGNEGAGLPEEVVHTADGRIHIPMATNVESLNAGAAAAVVLYEAYRQRRRVSGG